LEFEKGPWIPAQEAPGRAEGTQMLERLTIEAQLEGTEPVHFRQIRFEAREHTFLPFHFRPSGAAESQ